MSFIPKNPMTVPKIDNTPPTPPDGCRGLFCDESGWHDIDDNGKVQDMSSITDLGEITTQEELDNLLYTLEDGVAKFTCKALIHLNSSVEYGFNFTPFESLPYDTTYYIETYDNGYVKSQRLTALHDTGAGLLVDIIRHCNFNSDTGKYTIQLLEQPITLKNNQLYLGMDCKLVNYGLFRNYGTINNYAAFISTGTAWFQNPPKIGGTSYNDATAADVMSIRDLGVIDTQEQLDALQHLPTGYAKFKSKYGVYANNNTFVLGDEVHHGVAYFEYLLETIQSSTEYVVQFLKTSNYSQLQPMFIFRRYHRVAQENGTYYISNYSSGNFLANGDSLDFTNGVLTDAGEFTMNALRFLINGAVEFSDNAEFKNGALFSSGNVMFDYGSNVLFWQPPKTHNKIAAKEVPIAYTTEYRGLSTETNPVFAFSYSAMDTDTVYGVIESLTLEWSVFPGLSGDSSIGIHFDTGDTPPSISYSIPHGNGETLNWIGTDCALQDGLSIFAPSANKHYDICIYHNGTQYVAMVNGFTPATAN